ncbi:MAG: restriction endonuclease [Phycisphaerales bacterium]|nr:restriction endonuclease [Phycisphaerales bacterium]
MRIAALHSHLNGYEWLLVHERRIWKEIEAIVRSVDADQFRTKISKEKTMQGKALYAPIEINNAMKQSFGAAQWKESRTQYWVTDDYMLIRKTMHMAAAEQRAEIVAAGKRPIRSYNQTDFVKRRVAVEVQFGKYSFIAYDLFVKHLAFYVGDQIDVGVEVLPMKAMQESMSSGPGYYEGALYDIARQGRGVPAVPLVIIGVVP